MYMCISAFLQMWPAMNLTTPQILSLYDYSSSQHCDFLLNQIELTHVPDGRQLDSDLLLHAIINLISSHVSDLCVDDVNVTYTPATGSEETMGHTLYKISRELRLKCLEDGDIHTKTMFLLDVLGGYTWDAKVVLLLAAFATNYAEFRLITELSTNPLAESLAILKKLPKDFTKLGPMFKCLSSLIEVIIDVTRYIIKFEGLPDQHMLLEYKEISVTKSQISMAAYWIFRTLLACCSIFTNMPKTISKEPESSEIAIWELSSMTARLNSIHSDLKKDVNTCDQQTETRLYMKLHNLFKETYTDNQEVLHTLFCSNDKFPLQNDQKHTNVGISELKDKVTIVLVSKVDVGAIESLLFLVQQTYNHPYHKKEGDNYEILWVPITASETWTIDERRSLIFLSNSLPWFSIRQPWLLSPSTIRYVKEEWKFKEDPLMVAIDLQGRVINSNAIDIVFIWGARAFPFSTSRENGLWEDNTQITQLLVDGIDPLLMHRIGEGKYICIYGSDDIDWIREFNTRIQKTKEAGLQLEVVYTGTRKANKHIIDIVKEEKLSVSLGLTKMQLFWLRWDSMMKSIIRIRKTVGFDTNLAPVLELLDIDDNSKGWVIIGNGSSTVKLEDEKALEVLADFLSLEGELGAIRRGHHLAMQCDYSKVVAYDDQGNNEGDSVCDVCNRIMKKFIIYKCEVSE